MAKFKYLEPNIYRLSSAVNINNPGKQGVKLSRVEMVFRSSQPAFDRSYL
jgi:hypothetical protein